LRTLIEQNPNWKNPSKISFNGGEFYPAIKRLLKEKQIIPLRKGITLLGFRVFYHHWLLKKSNRRRITKRLQKFREEFAKGEISKERVLFSMAGWEGYAKMGTRLR